MIDAGIDGDLARAAMRMIDRHLDAAESVRDARAELLRCARELPLWLRRHGLAIAWSKLNREGASAAEKRLCLVLRALGNGPPLDIDSIVKGRDQPSGQAAYILASHAARRRADAFACVARLQLEKEFR